MTGALCAPLLDWYRTEARPLPWRENRDPYRVWLSEIMLQQTRVETVIPYFERFLRVCPTVHALAAADEQTYLKLWEGLGYYSRVRNLHRAAVCICEDYGGSFPGAYEELLALPGVGDYTAGAVASIAFGQSVPAVDGNVLRVVARLTADTRFVSDPAVKKDLRAQVQAILPDDPGAFNQALMELGAVVCIPNGAPKCGECPVRHLCEGAASGLAASLPNKAAKKARQVVERTVFLLRHKRRVALRRRPDSGLLAGLWEFPGAEQHLSPAEARAFLAAQGCPPEQLLSLRPAKHIFTHVEWRMTGYFAELADYPADTDLTFVTPSALREGYALPSAFRAFLRVLEGES
ncbi:MAG: A/G-specific adenine glycosylase [Intestinibacillus sp.]